MRVSVHVPSETKGGRRTSTSSKSDERQRAGRAVSGSKASKSVARADGQVYSLSARGGQRKTDVSPCRLCARNREVDPPVVAIREEGDCKGARAGQSRREERPAGSSGGRTDCVHQGHAQHAHNLALLGRLLVVERVQRQADAGDDGRLEIRGGTAPQQLGVSTGACC